MILKENLIQHYLYAFEILFEVIRLLIILLSNLFSFLSHQLIFFLKKLQFFEVDFMVVLEFN